MTTFYADSSALVKRYVTESGSAWLQTLVDPAAGHTMVVANIGLVEIAAALAAKQPNSGMVFWPSRCWMAYCVIYAATPATSIGW